ncbi:MAG: undecaprenyl-phosphate glucose phosphotransferase [Planctomycetota bacterium]
MLKQRHQLFTSILTLSDALAISAASVAAWAIRIAVEDRWWPQSWENYFKEPLLTTSVPFGLIAMWLGGLYKPRRDKSLIAEWGLVLRASVATLAAVVVVSWATRGDLFEEPGALIVSESAWFAGIELDAARFQVSLLAAFLPLALGVSRTAFRLGTRALRRRGWNLRHVAIVGTGRLGQITARTLSRNSWTGIDVAYFVSHLRKTTRATCLNRPVMGGLDDLAESLRATPVDAVYLALPAAQAGELPGLMAQMEKFAVDVRVVPDVHPRHLPQSMSVGELEGLPILSYRDSPLYGLGGLTKRCLDVVGALVGIVLFAPVMAVVAILVRLSGPGRIIFKTKRVGINGEVFNIYKFRTMSERKTGQEWDGWTVRDDPRITPIGRVLRRTSLDELPQLINVLGGRMSLVGPRPESPELIERFKDDLGGYMRRQHVKAGMTGWAQVNGLRGDTSLRKRVQYDLFYIRHWSIWFDVRILFMTIFRGFVHRNAH